MKNSFIQFCLKDKNLQQSEFSARRVNVLTPAVMSPCPSGVLRRLEEEEEELDDCVDLSSSESARLLSYPSSSGDVGDVNGSSSSAPSGGLVAMSVAVIIFS